MFPVGGVEPPPPACATAAHKTTFRLYFSMENAFSWNEREFSQIAKIITFLDFSSSIRKYLHLSLSGTFVLPEWKKRNFANLLFNSKQAAKKNMWNQCVITIRALSKKWGEFYARNSPTLGPRKNVAFASLTDFSNFPLSTGKRWTTFYK